MQASQANIFLIDPLNKKKYRGKIVFSDNANDARLAAAASVQRNKSTPVPTHLDPSLLSDAASVYMNEGMSLCIRLDEEVMDIIDVDLNAQTIEVKYHDVLYKLKKNIAEDILSESII